MRHLVFVPLLVLAACGDESKSSRSGGTPGEDLADLTRLWEAPEFKFLGSLGKPVDAKDLDDKVWVATFVFTNCQTHCRDMGREMRSLQHAFRDAPDFRIVSFTVDPARDDPDTLNRWGRSFNADPEKWLFLRHDRAATRKVAVDGFQVNWHDTEPLIHSTRFVLVDRDGWVRGTYDLRGEGRMEKLRRDIRTLLAESQQ